jgi:hypothetical protein
MLAEEKQQIIEKVDSLNKRLRDLDVPQLWYDFDLEDELVHLLYKFNGYNEWIGSIVDATSLEVLTWLDTQSTQLHLYKQLISYFGDGFAHAIIPNDSTITLTLNRLTYIFRYDRRGLVVTAFKYYVGKDLIHISSEVDELKLERLNLPHSRNALGTRVSLVRTIPETELTENLVCIQNTFKSFDDVFVN